MVADLRRVVNEFPEVSYVVTHTRPQRRRHRSVDALAHGSGGRAQPLQHLAGRRDQAGSDPAHDGAARRAAGLRDRIQPADHRQRARQGVRSAQRSSPSRCSATISTSCAASARTSSPCCIPFRASPMRPSTNTRRCRRSRSRSIAKRRRATASMSRTSPTLIRPGSAASAVSQVFIGERHYDVTVRFPPDARNSPEAIGNLVLTSSDGALIPLSQVAQHPIADRRKHDQSRDEPSLSAGEAQLPGPRPGRIGGGGHAGHRAKSVVRSAKNITSNGAASSRTSSGRRRASG